MKILVATGAFPPDIGGPATYSELLSRELPPRGIDISIENFATVGRYPKIIRHVAFFLKTLYDGRTADVIFAQDTVSVGLPAWAAAYVLGKVFMVRVPGDYAWEQSVQRYGVTDTIDEFQAKKYGTGVEFLRSIQRFVVARADKVVAPSRYFADLVRGWVSDPSKVTHIYNGLDIEEVRTAAVGTQTEPYTIISAGRLVPWKGFGALIHAMKQLPGWKLSIAGEGPEHAALAELIAREGLGDRVTLLGRLGKRDLMKRIAQSEVFVLNTSFESFSFQVVEAMALGTPVVTTAVGNLAEIVDDGASGVLVRPDDETTIVAAVRKIHSDQAFRSGIIACARSTAARFSIGATVDELMKTVTAVAESHPELAASRLKFAKIVRYLFSGGVAAVTNLVLLWILTSPLHIWYIPSSIMAFLIAFGVSFVLQKFFTFQDHGTEGIHGQAFTYFAVTGTNLLINTGLLYLLVDYAHMNVILAQILASILIAIESYVIYGMFIFKNRPSGQAR